jgi:flagellar protein FliT
MSVLNNLNQITKELNEHLAKPLPKDEGREEYIEMIGYYLEERQKGLAELKRPVDEQETKVANELIDMNQQVNQRLKAIQGEIRIDINQLKKRKTTGNKYANPYEGPTADGVFFDSKN